MTRVSKTEASLRLLGLLKSCTIEEIDAAYKREILIWHPDKNPGKDTTVQAKQINEAREHLTNRLNRRKRRNDDILKEQEREAREHDRRQAKRRKNRSRFIDSDCEDEDADGCPEADEYEDSCGDEGEDPKEEEAKEEKPYKWNQATFAEAVKDWDDKKRAQQDEKARSRAVYQAYLDKQRSTEKVDQQEQTHKPKHYAFTGKLRPVGWKCDCLSCKK